VKRLPLNAFSVRLIYLYNTGLDDGKLVVLVNLVSLLLAGLEIGVVLPLGLNVAALHERYETPNYLALIIATTSKTVFRIYMLVA
jgi:hypothetical protein